MADRFVSHRVIDAPVSTVWFLVSDPRLHHRFDGTGMVGQPERPTRLTHVGQVFTMNMTYDNGATVEHYQSDNHVVDLVPDRSIAWATATKGGPVLGWVWRYDLRVVPGGTQVALTYDWASASSENRARFGVPLTDSPGLARSLDLLAMAIAAH